MCGKLCEGRRGCSDTIFDETQLSCRLVFKPSNKQNVKLCHVNKTQPNPFGQENSLVKKPASSKTTSVCPPAKVSVFHHACGQGQLNKVRSLLARGVVDVNCQEKKGHTAIVEAVIHQQEEIFDLLLHEKCDLRISNKKGNTVLHLACCYRNIYFVKRLLDTCVIDINSKGAKGMTPLMFAVYNGQHAVTDLLRNRGADSTNVASSNFTILHIACEGGHVDMVKQVLSLDKIDIERKEYFGRTPLMVAVGFGQIEVAVFLMNRGADSKKRDRRNDTILHIACVGGHVEMVKYVLSLDVIDVESKGYFGRTPLLTASVYIYGHSSVVSLLRHRGANINTLDCLNHNILHAACYYGEDDVVKYIVSRDLIDINSRNPDGRTPIMFAALQGQVATVRLLRDRGADIKAVEDNGKTILHLSCIGGHVDTVKYVLTLNILAIECRTENGETPLIMAVLYDHIPVVRLLVEQHNASASLSNYKGYTVLHVACLKGHLDMVKYLVSLKDLRGFEMRKDKFGHTPVQLAERHGHLDIVSFLKSWKETLDISN